MRNEVERSLRLHVRNSDPVKYLEGIGWTLRPWQRFVIEHRGERMMIVATRQAGKTFVFAALAYWLARNVPGSLSAIVCPNQEKSETLIDRVVLVAGKDSNRPRFEPNNEKEKGLPNGSRIKGLPGNIEGVIGSTAQNLVFDEAGRIDRALFDAATPMQSAIENPWTAAISSAWWKRGWFYDAWESGERWLKVLVRARWDIVDRKVVPYMPESEFRAIWAKRGVHAFYSPTPTKEWIEGELNSHSESQVRQQYFCEFQDVEDAVFDLETIEAAFTPAVKPLFGSPLSSTVQPLFGR